MFRSLIYTAKMIGKPVYSTLMGLTVAIASSVIVTPALSDEPLDYGTYSYWSVVGVKNSDTRNAVCNMSTFIGRNNEGHFAIKYIPGAPNPDQIFFQYDTWRIVKGQKVAVNFVFDNKKLFKAMGETAEDVSSDFIAEVDADAISSWSDWAKGASTLRVSIPELDATWTINLSGFKRAHGSFVTCAKSAFAYEQTRTPRKPAPSFAPEPSEPPASKAVPFTPEPNWISPKPMNPALEQVPAKPRNPATTSSPIVDRQRI